MTYRFVTYRLTKTLFFKKRPSANVRKQTALIGYCYPYRVKALWEEYQRTNANFRLHKAR